MTFIAGRRFGRERFPPLYAVLTAIIAVFASLGPLTASILFDLTGGYAAYLLAGGAVTPCGAAIMAFMPIAARRAADARPPA